jgi:hypothetical protein
MSIENDSRELHRRRMGPVGAAMVGSMIGAAAMGAKSGYEKVEINSHVLTPAAISMLQQETGATTEEVSVLEMRLNEIMVNELKKIKDIGHKQK